MSNAERLPPLSPTVLLAPKYLYRGRSRLPYDAVPLHKSVGFAFDLAVARVRPRPRGVRLARTARRGTTVFRHARVRGPRRKGHLDAPFFRGPRIIVMVVVVRRTIDLPPSDVRSVVGKALALRVLGVRQPALIRTVLGEGEGHSRACLARGKLSLPLPHLAPTRTQADRRIDLEHLDVLCGHARACRVKPVLRWRLYAERREWGNGGWG